MILKKRNLYDRKRKLSITSEMVTKKENKHLCALENHKLFLRKQDESKRAMKKLFFVSMICLLFMVLEFIGGIISGSLAILCDAAHMFSDVAGFMISYLSIYISQRKATFGNSYGYHRAEILGALLSIFIIWGLLIWLNIEAVNRIITPPPAIQPDIMLVTSIIGFACNIVNFVALNCACGKEEVEEDDETEMQVSCNNSHGSVGDLTIEDKENVQKIIQKPSLALAQQLQGIVFLPR